MWQPGWEGSMGPTPLPCSFLPFSSFCACQRVLQAPRNLFASLQQEKASSLCMHRHSGTNPPQAVQGLLRLG